jgi:predicted enzyme related to lactoylglutathione lyase
MIKKFAFVAYPTQDVAKSKAFWETLGLKHMYDHQDKWAEFDAPDGKTVACDNFSPGGSGPYLALETDDIEAEVARLKEAGVEIRMDVTDNKVCKMAIIKDPNGHPVMLHQIAPERATPQDG